MLTIKNQVKKKAKVVLLLLCILPCIGVTTEKVFSRGTDLKISVYDDGRIDLYAVNVEFNDLLDAISLKTGIEFITEMTLSNSIDCDFEKKEIETAIRDLVRKTGFDSAIFYSKNINGNFVVKKVQIGVGDGKSVRPARKFHGKASDESVKSRPNGFTNNWYKSQFKDTGKLLKLIDVVPLAGELKGIRLSAVRSPSVFADLGLSTGDEIIDINNHPVRTKEDLIKFLNPKQLPSWIRIERKNSNQLIDPIYIRLTGVKSGNAN